MIDDDVIFNKASNKLENQLEKISSNIQLFEEQNEKKDMHLQPFNSSSNLEDYNVIQTQLHQQSAVKEKSMQVTSIYNVVDDNKNSENVDDCDNTNNNDNKKSGDNKKANVWNQVKLFQAGNAISKYWSLTTQELVLGSEFEQDGMADEADKFMNEELRHESDNVITVYFR